MNEINPYSNDGKKTKPQEYPTEKLITKRGLKMRIAEVLERIQQNDITVVSGLDFLIPDYSDTIAPPNGWVSDVAYVNKHYYQIFCAIAENTSIIELDLTETCPWYRLISFLSYLAFDPLLQNYILANPLLQNDILERRFKEGETEKYLIPALQENQTITTVSLSHNDLGDISRATRYASDHYARTKRLVIKALEELVSIKRLKKLDLSKNALTATHIEGLCRSLGDSNLEVLNLSKNKLKDEGVRMVLSALANHHCLKELIIHGNGISKAFLKEIPSLVEHIPGLKHIELGAKLKLPWNKTLRKDIDKKIEEHDGRDRQLAFFEACNFILMHWWRESSSPKSASPLAALPATVLICMLMQLRNTYEKTIPNKVIRARVREFTHEQNDTLCWNAYPEEEIKRPKLRKLEAIKAEQRTGVYNYALTANGQLFFGKKFAAPGGRHIDLVNGFPVRCAGEMRFKNGEMTEYDNASRHYQPSPTQTKKEMAFFLNAANEKSVKFVSKKWVEDKTPENGDEWVPTTMKK